MLFISLAVITFGLARSLPIVDEAIETPSTSEGPGPDGGRSGVVFDQRQTGKYNIHVSIKDVAIIEVGQNGLAEVSLVDQKPVESYAANELQTLKITFGSLN